MRQAFLAETYKLPRRNGYILVLYHKRLGDLSGEATRCSHYYRSLHRGMFAESSLDLLRINVKPADDDYVRHAVEYLYVPVLNTYIIACVKPS